MTINKRSKTSRQRGSWTHGWGHKKKHRGAGSRGGKGLAGTGKRGDVGKPSVWKNTKYFGKFGFKSKNISLSKIVDLVYFEQKIDKLVEKNLVEKKGDVYVIDASKLGFNKVLGYGRVTKKYKITAETFSKKAIEKIKAAGGDAIETGNKSQKEMPADEKPSKAPKAPKAEGN